MLNWIATLFIDIGGPGLQELLEMSSMKVVLVYFERPLWPPITINVILWRNTAQWPLDMDGNGASSWKIAVSTVFQIYTDMWEKSYDWSLSQLELISKYILFKE